MIVPGTEARDGSAAFAPLAGLASHVPAPLLLVGLSSCASGGRLAQLRKAGYAIDEAASIEAALESNARNQPKLVVLNAVSSDVEALSRIVKRDNPEVFVLQIGAADDSLAARGDVAEGVDAFLIEPVDPRELVTLVRSLMRLQRVEANLRDSERRLELAQESAGFAILDWSIATKTFIHSAMFATLFDLPERRAGEPLSSADILARIHPEDLGGLLAEFPGASVAARSFDQEFRIIRRDGTVRWISSRGRFLLGPGAEVARMISLSFDITARKEAERINAQLASIVASSSDAIISVDLANNITTWNTGAERLFGRASAGVIGQSLDLVLVPDSDAEQARYYRRLALGEPQIFETTQAGGDGRRIDISVNGAPMCGANGTVIGASLIMRDIAPQKQREDHVRFLMRELTHRSKNLLAVIQAMARQSLNKEIAPEEFVKRFSNRLSGLAGSHDLLSSVDWRGASLIDLVRSQLRHYEDLFETRIFLKGVDITIRPEAAQNIGIALHELSTNAAKYGALSNADGRVTIAWHIEDGTPSPRLQMTWEEANGPTVSAPTRRGFGHIVMDRVAGQALNGRSSMQFAPAGVTWTLDVPATSVLSG